MISRRWSVAHGWSKVEMGLLAIAVFPESSEKGGPVIVLCCDLVVDGEIVEAMETTELLSVAATPGGDGSGHSRMDLEIDGGTNVVREEASLVLIVRIFDSCRTGKSIGDSVASPTWLEAHGIV